MGFLSLVALVDECLKKEYTLEFCQELTRRVKVKKKGPNYYLKINFMKQAFGRHIKSIL